MFSLGIKKRIGEYLVDAGAITEDAVNEALRNKKPGQRIGDYLVGKGYISEDLLYEKLGEQLQIPVYRLSDLEIKEALMDETSIPSDLMRAYEAFPAEIAGSLLTVALSDPLDEVAMVEIAKGVKYDVTFVISTKSEILDYISKYYDQDEAMLSFVNDIAGNKMNSRVVLEMLVTHLNTYGDIALVLRTTKDGIQFIRGKFGTNNRDIVDLVDFVREKTLITKNSESGTYRVQIPYGDRMLNLEVVYEKLNGHNMYWISSYLVSHVESRVGDRFDHITESGIYVVLDNKFENVKEYDASLVGLNDRFKDRVLVVSDDRRFGSYGLLQVPEDSKQISSYSAFGDVFVFDRGWELGYLNTVFNLVSLGKIVLIRLPFSDKSSLESFLGGSYEGRSISMVMKDVIVL